jgi:hypothetical protein
MRTKVTLALLFLNVALFFFIFRFEREWRTEAASREARRLVLGPETANIRSLDLTLPAGGGFALTRERDAWFLTRPLDRWPANAHAVNAILHALQLLEHETSFAVADLAKNRQSVADFGLEKPRLTVAFTSGDDRSGAAAPRTTVLRIGDATPDNKRLYVLSPDGARIHVVNRGLADSLNVPAEQLRDDGLLSTRVFEARSLGVQIAPRPADTGGAGVRVRIRREGARWMFDAPVSARASGQALELAINGLNGLRAKAFPATGPATAPSTAPVLRLALEGNGRLETLFLGETVPPAPGAKPDPRAPVEFYAQLEGRRAVFTVEVPAALLETLRTAQESLREKRLLVDLDPARLTAISLASPVQPNSVPCDLRRLVDAPAGTAREAQRDWQVVLRGEGPAGPRTLPADPAALARLVGQLTALRAQKFQSDAPTSADLEEWGFNRPVREITLTVAGEPAPVVLRLGTDIRRNVYARVGNATEPGNSIYAVGREILDELALAPSAWRNRAVIDPLPANARVTRLRLTEVGAETLLAETAFNPDGDAAAPRGDPAALKAVAGAFRALRASRYVPGPFTAQVTAAGDDRPWRFQLQATVAVPGSDGAEQSSVTTVLFTERTGGDQQFAGIRELDTIFVPEQPLIDALWTLTHGPRDPGPPPERKP